MAFGIDDFLVLGGAGLVSQAASAGFGYLGDSGGSAVSEQRKYWDMMHRPMTLNGQNIGSRAEIENRMEEQQYMRQLQASSAQNLSYNQALNEMLPTAMRKGLEQAGYNPILGVLGSYGASTGGVSAPGGQSVAQPTITRPNRGLNSSLSFDSLAKAFYGAYKASTENTEADTDVKSAQVASVNADADLKRADANLLNAKAKTEDATRSEVVKGKALDNTYGAAGSIPGAAGRWGNEMQQRYVVRPWQAIKNFFVPDTNSAGSENKVNNAILVPASNQYPSSGRDVEYFDGKVREKWMNHLRKLKPDYQIRLMD